MKIEHKMIEKINQAMASLGENKNIVPIYFVIVLSPKREIASCQCSC